MHYGSNKSKRVARSVLAAEVHGLVLGFDYAFVLWEMLTELLDRDVKIEALVDSNTLFDVISKDASTTERRLQIDVLGLRVSHENEELFTIGWIAGKVNPAEGLTKTVLMTGSPLFEVMKTNRLDVRRFGWANKTEVQGDGSGVSEHEQDNAMRMQLHG